MKEFDQPPPQVLRFPIRLPTDFTDRLGYRGRCQIIGTYWECAGDDLAVYDGDTLSVGLHDGYAWLALMQVPLVRHWREEHEVDLGSSGAPETHHLVVNRRDGAAFVTDPDRARRRRLLLADRARYARAFSARK
jgi:hypothetical protein